MRETAGRRRVRGRRCWEPGTMVVLGVRTYFYPYRDGDGLLYGDSWAAKPFGHPPSLPLRSAGTLVRVLEETTLPNRRGAPLRRVLVEASGGGFAWVDSDDLEPAS